MKLTLEFIPLTKEDSLYRFLKRTNKEGTWREIKFDLINKFGRRCQICEQPTTLLELHEKWEYDEENCVQRLVDMQMVCNLCHRVKHMNSFYQSKQVKHGIKKSEMTKQELINHFCKVNDCSEEDFDRVEEEAFKTLRWRNRIKWKKDFSLFYKPINQ
ncbi:MAG: hypothetical protein EAX96_04160 [Candidatus Lokiarchaeota archaeon]|nr:hypothetical protein [Candidatus Lokiarchaeota archaeon]